MRLFLPGYEGNMNVKWLRRLKVTTRADDDQGRDIEVLRPAAGRAVAVVHVPDGSEVGDHVAVGRPQDAGAGLYQISGLAWSGLGGSAAWRYPPTAAAAGARPRYRSPCCRRRSRAFEWRGDWNGGPVVLQSRAIDEQRHGAADARDAAPPRADRSSAITTTRSRAGTCRRGRDQQCLRVAVVRVSRSGACRGTAERRRAARPGVGRSGHGGADRELGFGHQSERCWAAGGVRHCRGRQDGLRAEVPRVPRQGWSRPAERSISRWTRHDQERCAGAHGGQLLAVRDHAVRLHPPCDAARAAAVPEQRRDLRGDRVSALRSTTSSTRTTR